MKNKILFILSWGIFTISVVSAQTTIPSGNVFGTWTAAGSPYNVQGNITVHADSTLNVEPGVEIEFQGSYNLTVNGYLEAVGTESDSIHFTASTTWGGIIFSNAPDSSHLTYCTITGCQPGYGAGIYCINSNPVITYCTISNNSGPFYGGIALENSNPLISYCTISDNKGYFNYGSGISMLNSSPEISYCNIAGNGHVNSTGTIYCGGGSSALISHCSITGNEAIRGGGIFVDAGGNPEISNSTISDNIAYNGGGIYFSNGSSGTITDCIINADSTTNEYNTKGGGILISSSSGVFSISNTTISNCWSRYGGSGIHIDDASSVLITGSTFDSNICYNNSTVEVGAIYSANCDSLVIDHCDLVNNYSHWFAGGITINGNTNLTLTNSIFRSQYESDITFASYSSASVSYCDFYGSSGPFNVPPPGLGTLVQTNANGDSCDAFYNIYQDPLFVDFPNGDYNLTEDSPCIDAGDPNFPLDPDNTISDIGAYYFHQPGSHIQTGYVSGTWVAANSPYLIHGEITIHADSMLTIEPGVEVIFQGHYKFIIEGIIQAVGTENDSIRFTAADTSIGWRGLRFTNAPDGSQLSYCIIQYGKATIGIHFLDRRGGGIYLNTSRAQISHCTISNCFADYAGGAIYISAFDFPPITNCNFTNNSSDYLGGGIYFSSGPLDISDCNINQNTANGHGGGLYLNCAATDSVHILNCTISEDSTSQFGDGGGIYVTDGYVFINGCTITGNKAGLTGGGLYIGGYLSMINSTLQGNVSWGGTEEYETGGGGLIVFKSIYVDSCVIKDNISHTGSYPSLGGGILMRTINYSATITNNKIMNNTADVVGGMMIYANNTTLSYCEIINNQALLGGVGGTKINSWNSSVDHCTIAGNVAASGGIGGCGLINDAYVSNSIFSWNSPSAIFLSSSGTITLDYSDFYGNGLNIFGNIPSGFSILDTTNANGDSCDIYSNIFLDPLFVDSTNFDFHLTANSPCIDAGDPLSLLNPDSTITDMGVYYFDQLFPIISVNQDSLKFGNVGIGAQQDTTFKIFNIGTDSLIINDISSNNSRFSTNFNPTNNFIMPNDSMIIIVTFTPTDSGFVDDTLTIDNNDQLFEIYLSGTGIILPFPVIAVSDSLIDYGIVWINQSADSFLTIYNVGTDTLEIFNITNTQNVYTHNFHSLDSLILPGDSVELIVTFAPADTNTILDTLNISNNDHLIEIYLSGRGDITHGISDELIIPKVYALYPAYPNPFNPTTTIKYDLPKTSFVELKVFDILGKQVGKLISEDKSAGRYKYIFDGSNLASGLYFIQMQAGDFQALQKILLVK